MIGLLKNKKKYKGHIVISDNDFESAKGQDVLEQTSNDDTVIRHYDEDGNAENDAYPINLAYCQRNIMKGIHKQFGGKDFLISESALELIQLLSDEKF